MTNSLTIRLGLSGVSAVTTGLHVISREATQAMAVMRGAITGLVAPLAALAGGVASFSTVMKGVKFNIGLKEAQIGIAALLKQAHPERFRDFADAMTLAAAATDELKRQAVKAPGSFSELYDAFAGITSAADGAGMSIQQQIDLMIRMSQTMRTMQIPTYQMRQETMALLYGRLDRNAMVAAKLGLIEGKGREEYNRAKEAGKLFEFLMQKTSEIGVASEMSAKQVPTLLSNIGDYWEQFLGEITESLTERIRSALLEIERGMAILKPLALMWKDMMGDPAFAGDVIALSIEAAFDFAKAKFNEFVAWLSSGGGSKIWEALKDVFGRIGAALIKVFSYPVEWMSAQLLHVFYYASEKAQEWLTNAFKTAVNTLNTGLAESVNHIGRFLTKWMPGGENGAKWNDLQPLNWGPDVKTASWAGAGMDATKDAKDFFDGFRGKMDFYVDAWRMMKSVSGAFSKDASALEKLRAHVDGYWKKYRDAQTAADPRLTMPGTAKDDEIDALQVQEDAAQKRIADIQTRLAMLNGNYAFTDLEKRTRRLELLRAERAEQEALVKLLRDKAVLEPDKGAAEQLRTRADRYEADVAKTDVTIAGQGPDPRSPTQQMIAVMTELEDQWGSWAIRVANGFKNVFLSSTEAISSGFTDVIMGVKPLGEALAEIGNTIRRSIIKAIVDMGVQFVMTQVIMRQAMVVTNAITKAMGLAQVAQNGTTLATGAAAGVGTSGAQGGWIGILIYMGVLAAALAAVTAMTGGFAGGGYTGDGARYDPAGIVHRGEFVFSAPAVQAIGLERLESLHSGQGAESSDAPQRIVIVDNRRSAEELRRDPRFRSVIVDLARGV